MTQFKEKSEGREFVPSGLFTYPVLMAADILLYKGTVVPVGEDQLQHPELARATTARRFNHRFGRIFPEPAARLSKAARIMGLDGQSKMSKSKGNALALFEPSEKFWTKLKGAFTDSQRVTRKDPGRPEVCNIYTMHTVLSSPEEVRLTYTECTTAARGCVDCNKLLFDNFEKELVPLRTTRDALAAHPERVREVLGDGAAKARAIRVAEDHRRGPRTLRMGLGSGAS